MSTRKISRGDRMIAKTFVDPHFAKQRDRLQARGDGFVRSLICAKMDDAMFHLFMECVARSTIDGEIECEYPPGAASPPVVMNALFRWLLRTLDAQLPTHDDDLRKLTITHWRIAFIRLAKIGALKAEHNKFVVHMYWRSDGSEIGDA